MPVMTRQTLATAQELASRTSHYFAIDTETTGLPTSRANPTPENISAYDGCRMLSFAVVEFDENHKEVSAQEFIVYPDNFEVAATEIHGITTEHAKEVGVKFEEVYNMICSIITLSEDSKTMFVGHNLDFDLKVIRAELVRRELDLSILEKVEPVCTLILYRRQFLKFIKLGILYKQLFNKELEGAHGALADARAAGEVYPYLLKDGRTHNPIAKKKVIIKASEVAAIIGMNGFKKPDEVLEDMWKKNSPETFNGRTKEDRQLEALKSSTTAMAIYDATMSVETVSSNDVKQLVSIASDAINNVKTLANKEKRLVTDHLRKMLYTNHGTRTEDTTADLDEATLLKDDNFYSYPVITIEGTSYEIVGRIDRYQLKEDGTKVLVEIKNRTRRLFNKLAGYENVQVQTYLQMLGLTEARLIEQFNNERKSYAIDLDEEMWEKKIIPGLKEFCSTLHYHMSTH